MKLVSLELENIRSYKHQKIDFSDGVTLFEGDVGSGKSTLLYAIEFALFGLGDLRSTFLLRNDAKEGRVKLAFEVNGKHFQVFRSLQRKKERAGQGTAYVIEDGKKTEYSPEEMKIRVLQILGFNETPAAKATSWIYRYAVFTPQEEMKRVLELRDEERMHTLRKALGIEEYRVARDNAGTLARFVRGVEQKLEGAIQDLPEFEEKTVELEKQVGELKEKTVKWQESVGLTEKQLTESKAAVEEARAQNAAVEKLGAEIPLLERQLSEKKSELEKTSGELEKFLVERAPYETEYNELKKPGLKARKADVVRAEFEETREKLEAATKEASKYGVKALDYEELMKKHVCPTCEQPIKEKDFTQKIAALKQLLAEKEARATALKELGQKLEAELENARKKAETEKRLKELVKWLETHEERAKKLKEKVSSLKKGLPDLEKQLNEKQAAWKKSAELRARLKKLEAVLEEKQTELKTALQEKSAVQARSQEVEKELIETKKKISEKQAQKQKLQEITGKRGWLAEFFVPSLTAIEQSVLSSINAEFDSLFQKHFSLLIEFGDLSVRVSESFAPVVTQNGYEQDYRALSGGEKSALALAYRLALNAVVRRTTTSMRENLLILDEPTDGFSKEQLAKMRDVLNEIDCQQVLLVSHERELEAFADKVHRVVKQGSESRIEA